jgi:hypothetical protein
MLNFFRNFFNHDTHLNSSSFIDLHLNLLSSLILIKNLFEVVIDRLSIRILYKKFIHVSIFCVLFLFLLLKVLFVLLFILLFLVNWCFNTFIWIIMTSSRFLPLNDCHLRKHRYLTQMSICRFSDILMTKYSI